MVSQLFKLLTQKNNDYFSSFGYIEKPTPLISNPDYRYNIAFGLGHDVMRPMTTDIEYKLV